MPIKERARETAGVAAATVTALPKEVSEEATLTAIPQEVKEDAAPTTLPQEVSEEERQGPSPAENLLDGVVVTSKNNVANKGPSPSRVDLNAGWQL